MNFTAEKIYKLLPSYYRVRDDEMGGTLKALIEIIGRETMVVEKNIGELYANWFIETCSEWVVPYIGDLLGVRSLNAIQGSSSVVSQRAYIANTIGYRRRKGIAPILEQLALDVTGWRAHVVEFFELLATTQYMNHVRLHRPASPDLRRMDQLDLLDGPFDSVTHSADVRHISNGRGKYNIQNIGLFVWRLQNYPVIISDAKEISCPSSPPLPVTSFFSFDPTGNDMRLFNNPQTEESITHISTEINVPGLLRRRALFDELEARRQALVNGDTPEYLFFDDRNEIEGDDSTKKHCVFEIYAKEKTKSEYTLVPPEEILICNLEKCCIAPKEKFYPKQLPDGTIGSESKPITVAVDPVRGRFIFSDAKFEKARVSYSYGFSGDLGAGTYDRQESISENFQKGNLWQVGVSQTVAAIGSEKIHKTFTDAITEWNGKPAGTTGVIVVMDNLSYTEDVTIDIKEKSRLLIIAADWPERDQVTGIGQERKPGDMAAADLRPHLHGNIIVKGKITGNDFDKKTGGELTINGLLVEGKLTIKKGNLGAMNLISTTLIPANGGLEVGADVGINNPIKKLSNQWLKINMQRTICGPVLLNNTPIISLEMEDCIIDNKPGWAVKSEEAPVKFKKTSFLGKVIAKIIEAENCIFVNEVKAKRRQAGCIRYSFVSISNTDTPRRYRCQPDLEISTQTEEAEKDGALTTAKKEFIKQNIAAWLVPVFTSSVYGLHSYAQLSRTCPVQISGGADDGSEMGAFSFLMQPQRTANLGIALREYLRLGLEAGIFYVT